MELLAGRLIVEAGDASSTADIDPDDLRTWMSEIRDSVDARRAINLAWMPTQAPAFLRKLWSRPDLLAQANRKAGTPLSLEDLSLLYRTQDEPLTISDIPLIDELEDSLHPKLTEELLRLFLDSSGPGEKRQLIFTTHELHLLRVDLLRRDEIWLVEKNDHRSELTRLTDFPASDIRSGSDLQRMYMSGRLGGVPRL